MKTVFCEVDKSPSDNVELPGQLNDSGGKARKYMTKITAEQFSILILIVISSVLFVQCKTADKLNATVRLDSYLITCDTITVNDSSFYQPVFFRIGEKHITHTCYNEDYYFKILKKDSASSKVLFTSNNIVYDLTMKMERGGHLTFSQPEKTTRFRIFSIVPSK